MEVGTEISQKIRSAIKAKLMELGAYVDDELPDYIMVMVANKKTPAQMKSDLGLFLGANTDTFTGWLHGLLGKLQTITVDSSKAREKPGKSKGSKEKKKEKDKSQKTDKKDTGKDKKKSNRRNSDGVAKKKATSSSGDKITDDNANSEELQTDSQATLQNENKDSVKEVLKSSNEEVEDVRQLLVTETPADELAKELETSETEIEQIRTVEEVSEKSKTKPTSVLSKVKDMRPNSPTSRGRSRSPSPDRSSFQKSTLRKRKAPVSVVANINISRKEENEEEYDPFNPAVGSVASVVKVTSRKSNVPAGMQANRSLLLKAMTEAEKSIAVKRKVAVTRPMTRDDSPAEVYSPKRKRCDTVHDEASPPPYIPSRKESANRHGSGNSEPRKLHTLSSDDVRHTLNRDDRRELISRSRREELLRTIGIDRDTSERSRSSSDSEKKVMYEREVKGNNHLGSIKNFQITARVKSSPPAQDRKRHRSPSPDLKHSSKVHISPNAAGDSIKTSVISRLGKVVVERESYPNVKDLREEVNIKRSQSSSEVTTRDAREDIIAKASRSQSRDIGRQSGSRIISRHGKEAVQKQCAAAVLSVKKSSSEERVKNNAFPDSRVVHYDTSSENDETEERAFVTDKQKVILEVKTEPPQAERDEIRDDDDDDNEDLDRMINDDLEPALLDETHTDEFTLDLDDDDDITNVVGDIVGEEEDLQALEKTEDSKNGTRFIVTLDGVDEREFDSANNNTIFHKFRRPPLGASTVPVMPVSAATVEQQLPNQKLYLDLQSRRMHDSAVQQSQGLVPVSATFSKLTPPKIQPFSISLKDSDDEHDDKELKPLANQGLYDETQIEMTEEDDSMTAVKRAKMSERCKFWPACAAGSDCEYHHPTTHCKTFPNCKFGDKCLFIHPNCRFDSKCTRPDCPFTHTSRRSNLSSTSHVIAIPKSHVLFSPAPSKPHYSTFSAPSYHSSQTVCRFYPNCVNVNCAFLHPKPCRFGLACQTPACPFYHPPVPTKDKLKWQAQGAQRLPDNSIKGGPAIQPTVVKPSLSKASGSTTVSSTSQ